MATLNVGAELCQARDEMEAACARIADVQRALRDTPNPLPAQAPTEDQIVAALKADPAMAGRVMVSAAFETEHGWKMLVGSAAGAATSTPGIARALQSLAVALAAASYRG